MNIPFARRAKSVVTEIRTEFGRTVQLGPDGMPAPRKGVYHEVKVDGYTPIPETECEPA